MRKSRSVGSEAGDDQVGALEQDPVGNLLARAGRTVVDEADTVRAEAGVEGSVGVEPQ
jgi:hypothetical protein